MREAWESGLSVSKSSAGEAAVAQRAPVEHQAGTGWPAFHGAAYVHLELMTCCRFHELQIDHVIGFGKALRSWMRNRELHPTTKSFCVVDGVRARQSRKTADLRKIVTFSQIHTTSRSGALDPRVIPRV